MMNIYTGDSSMSKARYLKIFVAAMDAYAIKQGYSGKELSNGETRDMINAVCYEIKSRYGLSELAHQEYMRLVMRQVFGKNMGRK